MEEKKKWYLSLTVWGAALLAVCVLVLPLIGKGDAAVVLEESRTDIMTILTKIGEVVGLVSVVIGRFKAKTIVTL
jgi:hypothetical protein